MSKYGNKRTNGHASKKEARRANDLAMLERAGLVTDLKEQVVFVIAPSVVILGRKRPSMKYIADFVYLEDGKQVVEDVKGMRTAVYVLKRHLMASVHGIQIRET